MSKPFVDPFGPVCPSASLRGKATESIVLPTAVNGSITTDMFNTQKTLVSTGVKRVVTVTKEEKKRMREERAALEEEEKIKAQKATPQAVIDEEMRQIEALILSQRQQEEEEEATTKRQKKEEEEADGIERDGTEIPKTFVVAASGEDKPHVVSMDTAYADQRDSKMSTAVFYEQGRFPVDAFAALVTHNGRVKLEHCELAFVFNGAWWRNKRFSTTFELRGFIEKRRPERIDIGPVAVPGKVKMRYLVFDTDLEDRSPDSPNGYIRTCRCKGSKTVCALGCWFYMRVAVKCLTYVLRNVLGAAHIMPVSSGRRGVHTWVLDEQYLTMTEDERKGIVKRIEMLGRPWEYTHPEYTSYIYTYILKPVFVSYFLDGQKLILAQDTTRCLLEIASAYNLGDEDRSLTLHACIADLYQAPLLAERTVAWKKLCRLVGAGFKQRVIFTLLYPRLDAAVTTSMTHCVKSPLIIHPDSKRCCVPIPDIETWGPHMAPRISELALNEDELANPYGWHGYQNEQGSEKGAILTDYVNHMLAMISAAFPYPDCHR